MKKTTSAAMVAVAGLLASGLAPGAAATVVDAEAVAAEFIVYTYCLDGGSVGIDVESVDAPGSYEVHINYSDGGVTSNAVNPLTTPYWFWDIETADVVNSVYVYDTANMGAPLLVVEDLVCEPRFFDVPVTNPFFGDIEWMADTGISTGYEDGSFRPGASVSRQAMAAFMYRFAFSPDFVPPATPTFSDVPTNSPFYLQVEWMAATGISEGYDDNTFRPSAPVSRQAMSAFLFRLVDGGTYQPGTVPSFADVPTTSPFYANVEWMAETGISTGYVDDTFRPGAAVSRQAMAAFMRRADELPVG